MIRMTLDCNVSAPAIESAIMRLHSEYGSVRSGDWFVLICGPGHSAPATRAIDEIARQGTRIRLVILPTEIWPDTDRWVVARMGTEGVWSNGI